MTIELEQFIYSLVPNEGYKVTASSSGVDIKQWKKICEPSPIHNNDLVKISKAWTLRIIYDHVVISQFLPGVEDEHGRTGMFSHHLLIPKSSYIDLEISPISYTNFFISDVLTSGNLPLLKVNSGQINPKISLESLNSISTNTLSKIIEAILLKQSFTLVTPGNTTNQMLLLISALIQILPSSERAVSFITGPISHVFTSAHGKDDLFIIKTLDTDIISSLSNVSINIQKEYQPSAISTPQSKTANILVSQFKQEGESAIVNLHQQWENTRNSTTDSPLFFSNFNTLVDIDSGSVSTKIVQNLLSKDKFEAKRIAKVIIHSGKWKNDQELVELSRIILDNTPSQISKNEVNWIIHEIIDIRSDIRLKLYNDLIEYFPKLHQIIVNEIKDQLWTSALDVKYSLVYPDLIFKILTNGDFLQFLITGLQMLRQSQTDLEVFQLSYFHLLEISRKTYPSNVIDFLFSVISEFPQYQNILVHDITPDDLIPATTINHASKDNRKLLIHNKETLTKLFKLLCHNSLN